MSSLLSGMILGEIKKEIRKEVRGVIRKGLRRVKGEVTKRAKEEVQNYKEKQEIKQLEASFGSLDNPIPQLEAPKSDVEKLIDEDNKKKEKEEK